MSDASTVEGDDIGAAATCPDRGVVEGERVGRYLVLRDVDGRLHAVAAGYVTALCETDDGATLLVLSAGRMLHVPRSVGTLLAWLDGRVP